MPVTVGGLSQMRNNVAQNFVVLSSGMDLASVPARRKDLDIYRYRVLENLDSTLAICNKNLDRPFTYFEKSRVIREQTKTVPLTSKFVSQEDEPAPDRFNLRSFRPSW